MLKTKRIKQLSDIKLGDWLKYDDGKEVAKGRVVEVPSFLFGGSYEIEVTWLKKKHLVEVSKTDVSKGFWSKTTKAAKVRQKLS